MLNKVLILGESGTGKSTSTRTLDPLKTFYIHCDKKELPFRKWRDFYKTIYDDKGFLDRVKSNYYATTNQSHVVALLKYVLLKRDDIENIIIDTVTAILVDKFFADISSKGYEKFNIFGLQVKELLSTANDIEEDIIKKGIVKNVAFLSHVDKHTDMFGNSSTKFKSVAGKLVDQSIIPESTFTVVLQTHVEFKDGIPNYYFMTNTNGSTPAKSPIGMFDSFLIDNDLQFVFNKIKEYYG